MTCNYVLVTAARNEEAYIGHTLRAVVQQDTPPLKWIIVSDGSTDRTDVIVESYAQHYSFVNLLRLEQSGMRNFGAKAFAVQEGCRLLAGYDYEYIGNLDADVSFGPGFYSSLIRAFEANPRLGIAGGTRYDFFNGSFHKVRCDHRSVGGPFQTFRRRCFEDIEGYRPLPCGGIDAVAEITARMHGWEVQSFPEIEAYHHRCTGTAAGGLLRARFRAGRRDYLIGYHPVFQCLRAARSVADPPFLAGSLSWLSGFLWAVMRREPRQVPDAFVRYLRSEQKERMRHLLWQ